MDSLKKRNLNNNGLSQKMEKKKKCDLCEKYFFKEFMKKHMQVSHPGLKTVKKAEWQNLKLNTNDIVLGVPESITEVGIWLIKTVRTSFANCAMKNLKFNIP